MHGLDLTGLRREGFLQPVEDEELDPCDLIVMERLSMEGSVIFVALGKQEFRLLPRHAQLLGQLTAGRRRKVLAGVKMPGRRNIIQTRERVLLCAALLQQQFGPSAAQPRQKNVARAVEAAVAVHERARLDLACQGAILPPQGEAFICRIRQARRGRSGKCKTPEQNLLRRGASDAT